MIQNKKNGREKSLLEPLWYSMFIFVSFFMIYVVFVIYGFASTEWSPSKMLIIPFGGMFFVGLLFMRNTFFKLYILFNNKAEASIVLQRKVRSVFKWSYLLVPAINIVHCVIMYGYRNFTNASFGGFLFMLLYLLVGSSLISISLSKAASDKMIDIINK